MITTDLYKILVIVSSKFADRTLANFDYRTNHLVDWTLPNFDYKINQLALTKSDCDPWLYGKCSESILMKNVYVPIEYLKFMQIH